MICAPRRRVRSGEDTEKEGRGKEAKERFSFMARRKRAGRNRAVRADARETEDGRLQRVASRRLTRLGAAGTGSSLFFIRYLVPDSSQGVPPLGGLAGAVELTDGLLGPLPHILLVRHEVHLPFAFHDRHRRRLFSAATPTESERPPSRPTRPLASFLPSKRTDVSSEEFFEVSGKISHSDHEAAPQHWPRRRVQSTKKTSKDRGRPQEAVVNTQYELLWQ